MAEGSEVGRAFVQLGVNDKEYGKKMGKAQKGLKGLGAGISAMTVKLAVLGTAFGLLARKAVKAFNVQEMAEKKIEAALRAHGDAVDKLMPKLKTEASAIQRVTTSGDEANLMMMASLRNLGIQGDALGDGTKAAIGLAAALDMDAKSAARYAALAMQGEFTILQRYVPALRKATTESEKQAIVLDLMNKGFKQAQMTADTVSGRFGQVGNSLGDLGEAIVGAFGAGGMADVLLKLRIQIDMLAEAISNFGKSPMWQTIRDATAKTFGFMRLQLERLSAFFGALSGGAGLKEALRAVQEVPQALALERQEKFREAKAGIGGITGLGGAGAGGGGDKGGGKGTPVSPKAAFVGFSDAIRKAQEMANKKPESQKMDKDRNKFLKEIIEHEKEQNKALRGVLGGMVTVGT